MTAPATVNAVASAPKAKAAPKAVNAHSEKLVRIASKIESKETSELFGGVVKALSALLSIPSSPVFNPAPIRAALKGAGLDTKEVEQAVDFAAKKHAEKHGDTAAIELQAVINAIAGEDIETFATTAARMAREARKAGKINLTPSEARDAVNGKTEDGKPAPAEHVKLVLEARKLRQAGKAWSEVYEALTLTDSAGVALYTAVKALPDAARKAWSANV